MRRVAAGTDARRTSRRRRRRGPRGATTMILATTTFEDYDRFMEIFSTKGAEKRGEHGCKGAQIFRDPKEDGPGLGALRLGRGGVAELRLRPRRPPDHAARPGTAAQQGPPTARVRRPGSTPRRSEDTVEAIIGACRRPHQGGRHHGQTGALCRSWAPRTRTWPRWWSTTSTPRAACLGRPVELLLEDSETTDEVGGGQGRQARAAGSRGRDLRRHLQLHAAGHQGPGRGGRAARSTSTPSSTRGRSATRSSSAPARCRRSRSSPSSPG